MGSAAVVTPLDDESFIRLASLVKKESDQRIRSGELSIGSTLRELCLDLLGHECSRAEQVRFLFYAAPIARQIAVSKADVSDRVGTSDVAVTVGDLKPWLLWHDLTDPLVARMIDLHYFCGVSIKETAAALRISPEYVIRDLRFAKSWLKIVLPGPGETRTGEESED